MAQPQPTLQSLAQKITKASEALAAHLAANNLPGPSFTEDGPADYLKAPEIQPVRFELMPALADLQHLVWGPRDYVSMHPVFNNHDNHVLDILNQFNFFAAVPLGRSATYAEIARATAVPEAVVRRVLRYAFTIRVFAEAPNAEDDAVVHTATSAFIVRYPLARSFLAHNLGEFRPSTMHTPEALKMYSKGDPPQLSQEPTETPIALADLGRTGRRDESF